ncbi:hypothetical protein A3A56_03525 [Candidatus Roizmanbacteria bacterium RIFCSPLOWO2_01_FULL_40_32]|nr:MAG: hypothetical protein A3A56_03525 [Candidatus Roizmanbacteria bacterium RIFCSPLOWO2_01_FULL_40_32]
MSKLPLPFIHIKNDIDFKRKSTSGTGLRIYTIPLLTIVILLILVARLFQLTIVKGAYFRTLAENNRIREVMIPAPRATIVDRMGIILAKSEGKKRIYSDPEANAHFLGYVQSASPTDISQDACKNKLASGDETGKKGVENIYECAIRGINGKKLVEVDAGEKPIKVMSVIAPIKQPNLRVSLDADLQKKAYEAIENNKEVVGKRVAVIATRPDTGEILALLSLPTFSSTAFIENDAHQITQYFKDEEKPLLNRVFQGTYPPGSVFKPVIAAGALEEKKIDEKTIIEDTGTIKAGAATFGNWYFLQYGKTEGNVDIVKAIRRSNDIFFYRVGARLGDIAIKKWAEKFGYGKDIGTIPSSFWKQETIKENWYLGDTYNMSIGQGYTLVTPGQVNQANAVFANGGSLCTLKMLFKEKPECHSLGLSKKTIDLIREGMKGACAPGGTGWPLFNFAVNKKPISVGCKTGTAQSHELSGLPHAWFSIFAPFENPEIMITVMVEESGEGSNVAAPIAKKMLETYFGR